jgi:hypothetical protein
MPFSMFLANLILIVIIPFSNMYYIFSGHTDKQKAIWNFGVSCYGILVFIPTALFLGSFKRIFQLFIIFDKIHVVCIISICAYQALFGMMGSGNQWINMLRGGFVIQGIIVNIMFKLMLV